MPLDDYEIIAGFNNSGTAVNIESITPTGANSSWQIGGIYGGAYYAVYGIGRWRETREQTSGASTYRRGFTRIQWILQPCRYEAYADFYSDYVIDSGGKVTVKTPTLTDVSTFVYQNAVISMTQPDETERNHRGGGLWVTNGTITLELRGTAS